MYMIPLLYLNILTSFMLLLLRTRVVLSGKKATDILIRKIIKFNVFFSKGKPGVSTLASSKTVLVNDLISTTTNEL